MSDKQGSRRRLPRPATVLAAIAVFAVLAGTATAAGGLISGSKIKKGTITGKQIKNKSLSAAKLSPAALKQLRGERGERGPAGPKGDTGAQGPAGVVAPLYGVEGSVNIAEGEEKTLLTVPVPAAGKYAITAKTNLFALQSTTRVECFLSSGGVGVDFTQWTAGSASSRQPVGMVAVATASPEKPIQIGCGFTEGNGSAFETHVVAIPVS